MFYFDNYYLIGKYDCFWDVFYFECGMEGGIVKVEKV